MLSEHYYLFEKLSNPTEKEKEEELRKNCWFDYRIITAAEATFLFATTYKKTYAKYYGKLFDIREELRTYPQIMDIGAIWLARQAADAIGCKYDFYLNTVFQIFDDRGWEKLPSSHQLHSEELTIDITRMWKERCDEVLQLAESDHFTASAYVGHPEQVAYYVWLIGQIKKRPQGGMIIDDLIKRGVLPVVTATWPSTQSFFD